MDGTRLAPTAGIAASLVVLAALAAPLLVVVPSSAVWTYYGAGAVNPVVVGIFALVGVIVFAAGRQERSSPDFVAGAMLVVGLFMVVLSAVWALTVPLGVVTQLTTETALQYHRAALVLASLLVPASAVWYARALRIF